MRRVDESAWKFEAKPEKEFELTSIQIKIDPIQTLRECTTVAESAWKFQSKR